MRSFTLEPRTTSGAGDRRSFTGRSVTGGRSSTGGGHDQRRHTGRSPSLSDRRTTTGSLDRRRHDRHGSRLKVRILTRERETICFTRSISQEGVFIHAEDPLPDHRIIRMRVALPDREEELDLLGVVRWSRSRREARNTGVLPGMGVSFYQLDPRVRRAWDELVGTFDDCLEIGSFETTGNSLAPAPPDEPRRRQARVQRALTVSWTSGGRHYQHVTEDVSLSGFFVPCAQPLPVGSQLTLTLFSTATLEAVQILGQVARSEQGEHGRTGIGVAIVRLLDGSQEDLVRIVGEPEPPVVEPDPMPEVPRLDSIPEIKKVREQGPIPEPEDPAFEQVAFGLADTMDLDMRTVREKILPQIRRK